MKKILSIWLVVICMLALLPGCGTSGENQKRAEEIYQNFLGKSFSGKDEDDGGFYSDYMSNSLDPYKIYWNNITKRELKFRKNGTVDYAYAYEMVVLAYPSQMSEPDDYESSNEFQYDTFEIVVKGKDKIFLKLGNSSYEVTVNENNVPIRIDYEGTLLR